MERSKNSLWHRCGTCGTIFMSVQELRAHVKTHQMSRVVASARDRDKRSEESIPDHEAELDKTT